MILSIFLNGFPFVIAQGDAIFKAQVMQVIVVMVYQ